jgi:hypothetical protein
MNGMGAAILTTILLAGVGHWIMDDYAKNGLPSEPVRDMLATLEIVSGHCYLLHAVPLMDAVLGCFGRGIGQASWHAAWLVLGGPVWDGGLAVLRYAGLPVESTTYQLGLRTVNSLPLDRPGVCE